MSDSHALHGLYDHLGIHKKTGMLGGGVPYPKGSSQLRDQNLGILDCRAMILYKIQGHNKSPIGKKNLLQKTKEYILRNSDVEGLVSI